ncbi:MAG: class I SAM-dependent methyltransferase [Cytophagales bacterium]|nr:MAG: class I SAM-dependent methyltransferase [Cytophagales bacterium]TAF62289.1 MAG: class I SAM-dependent methyltransferase [Cytophagales bacterium]
MIPLNLPTKETWDLMSRKYEARFMDMKIYDKSYDLFLSFLPIQSRVFEIGCGPGNITRYLKTQRPDLEIESTDFAPSMVVLAQKNVPDVRFFVLDAEQLHTIQPCYQGVVCGFCMPYLTFEACKKLFTDTARILDKLGVFYVSFLENEEPLSLYETSSDGLVSMLVHQHTHEDVSTELVRVGFAILYTERITYTRNDGAIGIQTILICRKLA